MAGIRIFSLLKINIFCVMSDHPSGTVIRTLGIALVPNLGYEKFPFFLDMSHISGYGHDKTSCAIIRPDFQLAYLRVQ